MDEAYSIDNIYSMIANGARKSSSKEFKTEEEWEKLGLLKFKRRVLGLCGKETVKSLDDLTETLMDLGVVDSVEDGHEFVQNLYGREIKYSWDGYLEFTAVNNNYGTQRCRITKKSRSPVEM